MATLKARGRTSLERILWAGMFAQASHDRRGLTYGLIGKPGIGKTSIVGALAKQAGLHFETVIASLRDPSDFLGLPMPGKMALSPATQHLSPDGDSEITVARYAPADFALRAAMAKHSLVLLDEANTAPPAVQASLLRLLFGGVCGELQLPPTVRFILAMNSVEDAAGGWDIAPALANRVGWLPWHSPDVRAFGEFLMQGCNPEVDAVDPRAEERAVDAVWGDHWAPTVGAIAGFLSAKPDLLHKQPPSGSPKASGSFPTPRTWEMAARARTVALCYGLSEGERAESIGAFVGAGAAGEFHTWVKNNDLPDPTALLDGHITWTHNPARLDRTAAVLTACTSVVVRKDNPKRADHAKALWRIHLGLVDTAADIALGSIVTLCNERLMLTDQAAYKVLAAVEPVMSAAGLTPNS